MKSIKKIGNLLIIFTLLPVAYFLSADQANDDQYIQYVKDEAPAIPARINANNISKVSFYLNNGERVYTVENSADGDFIKITNDQGKTGWVKSNILQSNMSLRYKADSLSKELAQLKQKLNNSQNGDTDELQNSIAMLEEKNKQLEQINQELQDKIDEFSLSPDKQKQDEILKWFTRGGMVAGAGFLVGILITLIWPRRRERFRW